MKKKSNENKEMRKFKTGATRGTDCGKLDYEGFLSPLVLERYAQYMNEHRIQADGQVRASDNWQKGIPKEVYMKSMWRHFMDVWRDYRGYDCDGDFGDKLCALMFNTMGMLHEYCKLPTAQEQAEQDKIDEEIEKWQNEQMVEGLSKLAEDKDNKAEETSISWIFVDATDNSKSNTIGVALGMVFGALAIGCVGFGLYHLITGALA